MTSEAIHHRVQVTFRYPVHFTHGLFEADNLLLRQVLGETAKVLCVVDRGVVRHQPTLLVSLEAYRRRHGLLELVWPPLVVEGGEAAKNDATTVERVRAAIHDHGICRHSYVLAIGGGAVLDAVGFAAATAHRGVRLVRVPTTVLSQNDSGVGVKNGINAYGRKNFLGCFAPPHAVLCDLDVLRTLSDRDWRAGIAEALKVALLKDAAFFAWLEENAVALRERDEPAMERLVRRCAELHLEHIATSGDPFELGSSRPLDFGHWAAHKLEALSRYTLRHGEAVGVGIALDATYAYLAGLLAERDWRRVLDAIAAVGLPLHVPELQAEDAAGRRELLAGLDEFREHLGGRLTIMLLKGIGRGIEVHAIDEVLVLEAAERLEEHEHPDKEDQAA